MLEPIKIKLLIDFKLNNFLKVVLLKVAKMRLDEVIDSTKWKQMMHKNFKVNATNNAIFFFFFINEN